MQRWRAQGQRAFGVRVVKETIASNSEYRKKNARGRIAWEPSLSSINKRGKSVYSSVSRAFPMAVVKEISQLTLQQVAQVSKRRRAEKVLKV